MQKQIPMTDGFTVPVLQTGASTEQDQQQKQSENSTSGNSNSVQQATEPNVYMESDCQPYQSASYPCVLHASYGRTTCPHQETQKGAWKRGRKG